MNNERELLELANLAYLKDNWDEEGSPIPSEKSVKNAHEVLMWAADNSIKCDAVDPDPCGGVSLTFGKSDHVSVFCSNSNKVFVSIIPISEDESVQTFEWNNYSKQKTIEAINK